MNVSVSIVTFNHEAYIAQALDSVLMQDVDFEYEIVVGDDCSTDQTRKILLEYKEKYPDQINLILQDRNVGMHANGEMVINACKGEYIAVLDGDDYWIDKNKLQKQFDFLKTNPEVTECFHVVTRIYEDNSMMAHEFPIGLTKKVYGLEDVISSFFIPTLSIMFKKFAIKNFSTFVHQMTNVDWLIHVMCAQNGKIGFIDEVMGVHRIHKGGVWSGIKQVKVLENTIVSTNFINKYLDYKYDLLLKKRIASWHYQAGNILIREFLLIQAVKHYLQCAFLAIESFFRKFLSKVKY